ncbi:MAG TPA: hypothetical protein VG388_00060 [Solirubrobacteraceae bacterium]|nr:hypothetical protein [Solirubrobacteraceae bacterium]
MKRTHRERESHTALRSEPHPQHTPPESVAPAAAPEVRRVRTRGELTAFIRLPWRLYDQAPNWVPRLVAERRRHLDKSGNPFFEHAEAEYFLAWREGEPAWASNWGFMPLTESELDHMAKELKPVLDEDFACVAETADGEVAGLSLSLPDFNQILARVNGRMLPRAESGWILETNEPMNWAMEALTGRIVKRYRLYERMLDAGA